MSEYEIGKDVQVLAARLQELEEAMKYIMQKLAEKNIIEAPKTEQKQNV